MSAFYARAYDDRVELLTDAAVYAADDGTLRQIREKVARLANVPAALTVRGEMLFLDGLAHYLDQIAGMVATLDETLECVPVFLDRLRDYQQSPFEAVLCGISESEGPGIWYLANVDCGFAPFELHKIEAADFGAGPGEAGDLERFDFSTGLADHGPEFFELMRSRKAPSPVNPDGPWLYGIGGALDHTVIRAEGVSTTRLRTWPDFLGLPIDPFRLPINRQQRRALERQNRKRAA